MSDPFITNTMNLTDSAGNLRAQNLLAQLDPVNLPWNQEAQGMIPTDWYDLFLTGVVLDIAGAPLIPNRSDYFVDVATGTKYSVFSTDFIGPGTIQLRVSKYSGVTP